MKRQRRLLGWKTTLALVCCLWQAAAAAQDRLVIENHHFKYEISAEAKNLSFVDAATGTDYLRPGAASACALVRRGGKEFPATAASASNGRLILRFEPPGVEAALRLDQRDSWVGLTVESVKGPEIDSLVFLNAPLTLKGVPDEPFGACALGLNLETDVEQLPALQSDLRAEAFRKFGILGAKVALAGLPPGRMLAGLKEALSEAGEMPPCKVAGPWAQEAPMSHGSYLFNFGTLTEQTVDEWIEMAHGLGFTQIDNHGGSDAFFRFGDFALNRQKWPEGWETYRRIVARLHEAGISSIFHTYAFFIDKHSKYVSPVPDPRLDAFRTFTLAEDVAADADTLPVKESTAGMSTVTGFFVHNSVVLHLGDELATFGGFSREPPWRFTGVKRGALGTKAASHAQGSPARHLKECFGLFVPDAESSLFTEIAANHAQVVNDGNFDGVYLDAIDGSAILRGGEDSWYWASKFVAEIQKRLKRPVGMEMSAMWPHFWQYRTRWQAWDYPQRGHKRFIDFHAQSLNGGLLLPLHLGWWGFQSFNPPQIEPTYPDVIECLGARMVGWDAGASLTAGVDREKLKTVPLFRRAVDTLRACEEIRHAGTLSEAAKARLREPGSEFSLFTDGQGNHRFRRSHSEGHTAAVAEPWSLSWTVASPFPEQTMKVRIETLMSAGTNGPGAAVVGSLGGADGAGWQPSAARGVVASVTPWVADGVPAGGFITATNSGLVERHGAWARYRKVFKPLLNLKDRQALGLWIDGDGQGEVIAVRLESPQATTYGAIADRYVTVDFTGKRWFSLVETESTRWSDYTWNDGKGLLDTYRETIDFGAVESAEIWCQNLPPGKPIKCGIGPVKALPMLPGTVKNPAITVNGATLVLATELTSGGWLECNGPDDCVLYGSNGEVRDRLHLTGRFPLVRPGQNQAQFSCAPGPGPSPRVKVTFFTQGEPL